MCAKSNCQFLEVTEMAFLIFNIIISSDFSNSFLFLLIFFVYIFHSKHPHPYFFIFAIFSDVDVNFYADALRIRLFETSLGTNIFLPTGKTWIRNKVTLHFNFVSIKNKWIKKNCCFQAKIILFCYFNRSRNPWYFGNLYLIEILTIYILSQVF